MSSDLAQTKSEFEKWRREKRNSRSRVPDELRLKALELYIVKTQRIEEYLLPSL